MTDTKTVTAAELGLYPGRRTLAPASPLGGLTTRQAGELARIQARYGRCATWLRSDGRLLIQGLTDKHGRVTLQLLLDPDGHVLSGRGQKRPRALEHEPDRYGPRDGVIA